MFTALADGLTWMMGHNGVKRAIHYLDDYLFFGRATPPAVRKGDDRLCVLFGGRGYKTQYNKSTPIGDPVPANIESGLGDPFTKTSWPRLEYVLKGIKRNQAETGVKSKPRLPITSTEPNVAQGDIKMIWAACCLCFFGFLRCGEMTVPGDSEYDPAVH